MEIQFLWGAHWRPFEIEVALLKLLHLRNEAPRGFMRQGSLLVRNTAPLMIGHSSLLSSRQRPI